MIPLFSNPKRAGFTLIETLVAVTILTLSVAGPLYVASRAVVAAQLARDRLVASYLAQEGIEYVRAMRDRAFLEAYRAGGSNVSDTAWNNFLSGSGAGSIERCLSQSCALDPFRGMGSGSGLALEPCISACSPLYLNGSNGRYSLSTAAGNTQTKFTRTIQGRLVSGSDMRITSTVMWASRGTTHRVIITDHLTPWQ